MITSQHVIGSGILEFNVSQGHCWTVAVDILEVVGRCGDLRYRVRPSCEGEDAADVVGSPVMVSASRVKVTSALDSLREATMRAKLETYL